MKVRLLQNLDGFWIWIRCSGFTDRINGQPFEKNGSISDPFKKLNPATIPPGLKPTFLRQICAIFINMRDYAFFLERWSREPISPE